MLPREEKDGKANQVNSWSDIGNQVRFSQATQGAAGERLSRAQRGRALPPGEGRYGSGTSGGVEADTVRRKAIRSGTWSLRLARTRHVARLPRQRERTAGHSTRSRRRVSNCGGSFRYLGGYESDSCISLRCTERQPATARRPRSELIDSWSLKLKRRVGTRRVIREM